MHPTQTLLLQAYIEEEKILARATGFAADETLRLPPRLPGEGLHQSLIDVARAQNKRNKRAARQEARERAREARAAAAASVAAGASGAEPAGTSYAASVPVGKTTPGAPSSIAGSRASTVVRGGRATREEAEASAGARAADNVEDGSELSDGKDGDDLEDGIANSADGSAAVAAAAAYGNEPWLEPLPHKAGEGGGGGTGAIVVSEWDRDPTARERGQEHDVVVTGPSMAGTSTLCRALAEKYQAPVLTIDSMITEAMRLRTPLGARVRAALHRFTAKEEVRRNILYTVTLMLRSLETRMSHRCL